jgi:Flp pilus assembly protein TadG
MNLRQGLASARGTSTLEFIAVFPFLLLILLVGVEFSRAWLTANVAQNAVREGVRIAVVTPAADDPVNTGRQKILDILTGPNFTIVSGPTVTCNPAPCDVTSNSQVTADVTVEFRTIFPGFLPQIGTFNIRQSATMRYE